jgi:3-dehydroquinate dehydratase-2
MKKILILNGPNLNLLGKRQPEIYGKQSFEDYLKTLKDKFPGVRLDYFQSNHEGDLIDKLQAAGAEYDAVVFNPAAYTHTSIALRDTVAAIDIPVAEVHISNIYEREEFRRISYIRDVTVFSIIGKGLDGYAEAIERLLKII